MKPEQVKPDGRAFGTNQIRADLEFIDPEFRFEPLSNNRITPTGLLVVAKLVSDNPNLPEFSFRWDNKQEALDVDVFNVNRLKKFFFLSQRAGYKGHRTKRVPSDSRIYYCDITIQERIYFKGRIWVTLLRQMEILETISVTDRVSKWIRKRFDS